MASYYPTPALRRRLLAAGLLALASGCTQAAPGTTVGAPTPAAPNAEARDFAQYTELQWSDEFDGTALDPAKWGYEVQDTWYNNELEATTARPANVAVAGGSLHINALQESYHGRAYTSGRLVTKGKQEFAFGRLDVRAQLPRGKGLWPAIWLLGTNDGTAPWPACGEIDIMELRGSAPALANTTMHYGTTPATHQYRGTQYALPAGASDFGAAFHVFSCVRSLNQLRFYIDGVQYYSFVPDGVAPYPFNNPFYAILNVAVGGDFDGSPDASTTFPQAMLVDYVRYYQYK